MCKWSLVIYFFEILLRKLRSTPYLHKNLLHEHKMVQQVSGERVLEQAYVGAGGHVSPGPEEGTLLPGGPALLQHAACYMYSGQPHGRLRRDVGLRYLREVLANVPIVFNCERKIITTKVK